VRLPPPGRADGDGPDQPVLILTYHSVRATPAGSPAWLESTRTTIGVEEFRKQMAHIARHYHTITLEQLVRSRTEGGTLPANPCVITFDDGFADVYHHATRVLRDFGLTATLFVIGEPILSGEPAWIHAMYQLLDTLGIQESVAALRPDAPDLPRDSRGAWRELHAWSIRQLTTRSHSERQGLLASLRSRLGGRQPQPLGLLGASELRALAAEGFEIGAHSMAHEPLSALTEEELDRDLTDSRTALVRVLGREPRALAYPFGSRGTWNAQVVTALRRHGFQCACTTVWGLNDRATDPFELRRLDSAAMPTFASFLVRVRWARVRWRLRHRRRAITHRSSPR